MPSLKSWHNWSMGVLALLICWSLGLAAIESGQALKDMGIAFGGIIGGAASVAAARGLNKWAENGKGGRP